MKMAQNNIENQIREKLNSREIQPTEMAWDRLDAMLSVAEEKKTKRYPFFTFKNIGIAASILVFMSLGLFFINQKEEISNDTNTVVTKEIKNNNEQKDSVITKQNFINEIVNQQEEGVAQNSQPATRNVQQSSQSFNKINQKSNQKSISNKESRNDNQVAELIIQKELPKSSKEERVANFEKSAAIADNTPISNDNAIKKEVNSKVKVNANSLLSQVDGELEQTFRQKVINKIGKNYQEVKEALANRNQE
jgi:negative regulator of sigma E activity